MSLSSLEERRKHFENVLRSLEEIDRTALSPADQLNFDLFIYVTNVSLTSASFPPSYLLPINQLEGPHIDLIQLAQVVDPSSLDSLDKWIDMLENFRPYMVDIIELLKEGVRLGITIPRIVATEIPEQILSLLPTNLEESPLMGPVSHLGSSHALYRRSLQLLQSVVSISLRDLHTYLLNEYIPATRLSIGVKDLPNGEAFYRFKTQYFTTLTNTPEELHQIGLEEVQRIKLAMENIMIAKTNYSTLPELFTFVRTSPDFLFGSEDEMLTFIRGIAKQVDPLLPRYFQTLPRCPFGVIPIGPTEAPTAPSAYYTPPDTQCTRAGYYHVNTYDLPSRPSIFYISTTLHESVPGHHLQLALQQELIGIPPFRRYSSWGAYAEGWALYAEFLGVSMGIYGEDFFLLGRLGDEMLRATRLVVDTGLHYFDWSRQDALTYMEDNVPIGIEDIRAEVDRYISWPGQALGYKMGERKIRELRAKAEIRLRDKFDLREFHHVILKDGSLPLSFVAANVDTYLQTKQ